MKLIHSDVESFQRTMVDKSSHQEKLLVKLQNQLSELSSQMEHNASLTPMQSPITYVMYEDNPFNLAKQVMPFSHLLMKLIFMCVH